MSPRSWRSAFHPLTHPVPTGRSYPNNSIVHPETQPAAVACLLYLDDIEGRDGATAFVPCEVRERHHPPS